MSSEACERHAIVTGHELAIVMQVLDLDNLFEIIEVIRKGREDHY